MPVFTLSEVVPAGLLLSQTQQLLLLVIAAGKQGCRQRGRIRAGGRFSSAWIIYADAMEYRPKRILRQHHGLAALRVLSDAFIVIITRFYTARENHRAGSINTRDQADLITGFADAVGDGLLCATIQPIEFSAQQLPAQRPV